MPVMTERSSQPRRRVWQHPLVQFLALGILIWGLSWALGPRSTGDANEINVSPAQVEILAAQWQKQWRRSPTPAELEGLVESWIREEVLYREALSLGLDRGDEIVRRRLAQKIELLSQDLATQVEPSRQDLGDFFQREADRFRDPERRSFRHVYVNADRAGDQAESRAEELLVELRAGADPAEVGDRFMMPAGYVLHSQSEIERNFGKAFGEAVFALPVGEWQGPVASGYGLHLVQVSDFQEASMPDLADVERRVRDEYLSERRRLADQAFYDQLRAKYRVTIESPEPPPLNDEDDD